MKRYLLPLLLIAGCSTITPTPPAKVINANSLPPLPQAFTLINRSIGTNTNTNVPVIGFVVPIWYSPLSNQSVNVMISSDLKHWTTLTNLSLTGAGIMPSLASNYGLIYWTNYYGHSNAFFRFEFNQ